MNIDVKTLSKMAKIKKNDYTKYWQDCRSWSSHTTGTTTLKNNLIVSLKIKHIPTI